METKQMYWWEKRLDQCPECKEVNWIPLGTKLVYSIKHHKHVIQADACCEKCGIGITKFFAFGGTKEERDQILAKQPMTMRILLLETKNQEGN